MVINKIKSFLDFFRTLYEKAVEKTENFVKISVVVRTTKKVELARAGPARAEKITIYFLI